MARDDRKFVGVIYDAERLYVRRIVVDAKNLSDHLLPGEALAKGLRIHGHSIERAFEIVRLATGREPPSMSEAHANEHPADRKARGR